MQINAKVALIIAPLVLCVIVMMNGSLWAWTLDPHQWPVSIGNDLHSRIPWHDWESLVRWFIFGSGLVDFICLYMVNCVKYCR